MAVWLLTGVAASGFYAFEPAAYTASSAPAYAKTPAFMAPTAYQPEPYMQVAAPQYVPMYEPQYEQEGWSMSSLLLAVTAGAAAGVAATKYTQRPVAALAVDGEKAAPFGAACVGGVVGVYLFGDIVPAVILALLAAYGATTDSAFGDATRSAGSAYNKVSNKVVELNDEYELLGKAKSAADFTVAAASEVDENYAITSRIDEKLKLSQAVDTVKDKFSAAGDKLKDVKNKSLNVD